MIAVIIMRSSGKENFLSSFVRDGLRRGECWLIEQIITIYLAIEGNFFY